MTESPASEVLGRWRIVAIEGWDTDYVDMLGPGHIQLDAAGGHIEFGAVQISLDCWYSRTGAHFTFQGSDEGTEVSGDGDADIAETAPSPARSASTTATTCHSSPGVGEFPQPARAQISPRSAFDPLIHQ
jgi:hypothetical protein